ncbi:MAG: hypothetical protein HQL96_08495 [Magnetococcales bacterium]|nr:hypothetical protein [Magnetococcales bacterium]
MHAKKWVGGWLAILALLTGLSGCATPAREQDEESSRARRSPFVSGPASVVLPPGHSP